MPRQDRTHVSMVGDKCHLKDIPGRSAVLHRIRHISKEHLFFFILRYFASTFFLGNNNSGSTESHHGICFFLKNAFFARKESQTMRYAFGNPHFVVVGDVNTSLVPYTYFHSSFQHAEYFVVHFMPMKRHKKICLVHRGGDVHSCQVGFVSEESLGTSINLNAFFGPIRQGLPFQRRLPFR